MPLSARDAWLIGGASLDVVAEREECIESPPEVDAFYGCPDLIDRPDLDIEESLWRRAVLVGRVDGNRPDLVVDVQLQVLQQPGEPSRVLCRSYTGCGSRLRAA